MWAAAAWFHCPRSMVSRAISRMAVRVLSPLWSPSMVGDCIGTLPFWNAHCRPLPRENFCVGLKKKHDDRCSEHGADEDDCREDKKKCYWPADETDEAVGFCAAHKF